MQRLDTKWSLRYKKILDTIGEAYEQLEPSSSVLVDRRADFEQSGYTTNPDLTADKPDLATLTAVQSQITQLKRELIDDEPLTIVQDAYLSALDANLDTITLLQAGATRDMARYSDANVRLYGTPDRTIFDAACAWIYDDALKTPVDHSGLLLELRDAVLEVIPQSHAEYSILIPPETTFAAVKNSHEAYYAQLFGADSLPQDPYIDEHTGNKICQHILDTIGTNFVLTPSENNIWAILPSRHQIVYPRGYYLDRDEFIGIVCHEIGSHMLEAINGAKSPLKLLCYGLAGYEKGNEGRAFLREQIVYDHEHTFLRQFSWEYIVLLHVAVSLATGINGQPYDFVRLYDTLYKLYYFWRERREPRATNNEAFARQEAWYLAVRILKGTPGDGSAAYLKDTVYLEGNVHCWRLAASDPSVILLGDRGKFDITNPAHMELVGELAHISGNATWKM